MIFIIITFILGLSGDFLPEDSIFKLTISSNAAAPTNSSGYPTIDTATLDGFRVRIKINVIGFGYYVVVADAAGCQFDHHLVAPRRLDDDVFDDDRVVQAAADDGAGVLVHGGSGGWCAVGRRGVPRRAVQ